LKFLHTRMHLLNSFARNLARSLSHFGSLLVAAARRRRQNGAGNYNNYHRYHYNKSVYDKQRGRRTCRPRSAGGAKPSARPSKDVQLYTTHLVQSLSVS
jgi:hypothetical protein